MFFSAIASFVGGLFGKDSTLSETIDNITTTDEERLQLRNELARIESVVEGKLIGLEETRLNLQGKLAEAVSKQAAAEALSDSWFTRTYRPAIICGMFGLICASSFGILTHTVPDIFYSAFGATFGIIGTGRTFEKYIKIKKG